MSEILADRKNKWAMHILGWLCQKVVSKRFPNLKVVGAENVPKTGPFVLLANHTSRWDALVVFTLLKRAANYMTSPNELKGLAGLVLPLVGAFPADRRYDLDQFIVRQAMSGEPIVIFPEGGVFNDAQLHPFKKGTAHIILACQGAGLDLPVVPVAIEYEKNAGRIMIAPTWQVVADGPKADREKNCLVTSLTEALHHKLSLTKQSLAQIRQLQTS